MNRRFLHLNLFVFLFVSLTGALPAADNSPETRLREMLRSTMLQLRDAQNQVAALQTAQAESEQKAKTLGSRLQRRPSKPPPTKKPSTK